MISGIITGVILIGGAWFILRSVFYESRGEIVALYVIFYIIGFIAFNRFVFNAADFPTAIFFLVMVIGCMVVGFMYLVFGIPTLIFLKSKRKGAGGIADMHGRRITEDIPTSTIHTGAVGSYVEVKGKLIAFKRYLRDDEKLGRELRLSYLSFFIDDGSGSYALIDPAGADVVLSNSKLRLRSNIYVRGYAESGLDYQTRFGVVDWVNHVARMIPNNRAFKKRFDTNQDGVLDDDELKSGAETLSRELKTTSLPGLLSETKLVFRSSVEHPLIVSNRKELDLTTYLKKRSVGRMVQSVIFLVVTFIVFSAILSSCRDNCKMGANSSSWSCNTSN
ncbi:MAG: hypothetical protein ACQ9MH_14325 [Nitrospinales bacterium]